MKGNLKIMGVKVLLLAQRAQGFVIHQGGALRRQFRGALSIVKGALNFFSAP